MIWICIVLGVLLFGTILGLIFALFRLNNRTFEILQHKKDSEFCTQKNSELETLLCSYKDKLTLSEQKLQTTLQENATLNANLQAQITYAQNLGQIYSENLNTLKSQLEKQFLAQQEALLKQSEITLNRDSKKILEEVFTPLKHNIERYSQKLGENEARIEANITNMFNSSKLMNENAQKLAQVLKGDKKARGNFAELQLKSVLESSGLIEGEQYKLQEHFKLEGEHYYPDAVVYLDKHKSIIIDSKFSLPNDFNFEQIDEGVCAQLAGNLKARIDELAKKPYVRFESHTYDFTLLFIPYQNILDLALESNSALYAYAYNKKVYLTTPNTLFMALKTIAISWQHIDSNQKVLKAFEEIGLFYDKFAGVIEDFEVIKRNAETLDKSIDRMETKLTGKGGLSSRASKLKELGAKTQKSIEAS
ncbi:DNA recombination protein RmuC [Helicobacter himalayensis]|uniref:DNA recombination protein RmuC n=1 Tax=Helicobacter himalayensis TaxID=1591088 RepID=UPI003D6DBB08